MGSTETLDRATCSFCGSETDYRFCSWRCTVQGVGPELSVETNENPALVPFRTQSRDGWVLDAARDFDVYDLWLNGTVADHVMASLIQDTVGKRPTDNALYRSRQGGRERRGLERISETWTMDAEVAHYIAVDTDYLIQEAIDTNNDRAVEVLVDDLVDRFVSFRNRYFTLGRNKLYVTAEFHKEWITSILWSYYTGGKSMILAPPRSGKSELLTHFTTWLIVRNPDIRIAWVGGNTDIASDMVSSVRRHLESNERLIAETLPDGVTYAPQGRGSGNLWGAARFRVNNVSIVGQKAPTMTAIGRQGKVLSRDVDFLIVDDLEDHDSTSLPSARIKTRNWWSTQLSSRKEEHTGLVVIGSRQHADDLYGWILAGDSKIGGWRTIVNAAHDPDCEFDPKDYDAHVDCMLFPEIRTYRWLMEKKTENEYLGTGSNYEMVYLNAPVSESGMIFSTDVVETSKNLSRSIGKFGVPDGVALVAGLDPATTGHQAGFLWGYHAAEDKLYMIDARNQKGGGIRPALELIRDWHEEYRNTLWIVEVNGWQKAIVQSEEIRTFCKERDIRIVPHETQGSNKWDPLAGVSAMAIEFDHGRIDLPYANEQSIEIVDEYVRQLRNFTGQPADIPNQRRDKSDILMASWFPWTKQIRRWRRQTMVGPSLKVSRESSYPGYGRSSHGTAPWETQYPRRTP